MGSKMASKIYNVPKTILLRMARSNKEIPVAEVVVTKIGCKPVLPPDIEKQLVEYLLEMESKYFGLTRSDIKSMAFQLAKKNGIPNPFSKLTESAGRAWLKSFMKRHPCLSFRSPTGSSVSRALGFTRANVEVFFKLLDSVYADHSYLPKRIFNVDETGLSVVQSKHLFPRALP